VVDAPLLGGSFGENSLGKLLCSLELWCFFGGVWDPKEISEIRFFLHSFDLYPIIFNNQL